MNTRAKSLRVAVTVIAVVAICAAGEVLRRKSNRLTELANAYDKLEADHRFRSAVSEEGVAFSTAKTVTRRIGTIIEMVVGGS